MEPTVVKTVSNLMLSALKESRALELVINVSFLQEKNSRIDMAVIVMS